jgi:hypothetical protein
MKRLFVPVVLAAALSGCAVVAPYERPYDGYPLASAYDYPYSTAPGYGAPAPAYRAPAYVWPPVRLRFSLQFWKGRGGHHWHHHRHGFRPHRFGGWRR